MVDWTRPVQTRDGRKARVLCTNKVGGQPVVVLVEVCSEETIQTVNIDGSFHNNEGARSNYDIMNIPEKRTLEGWFNIKPETNYTGLFYIDKEDAERAAGATGGIVVYVSGEYEV